MKSVKVIGAGSIGNHLAHAAFNLDVFGVGVQQALDLGTPCPGLKAGFGQAGRETIAFLVAEAGQPAFVNDQR